MQKESLRAKPLLTIKSPSRKTPRAGDRSPTPATPGDYVKDQMMRKKRVVLDRLKTEKAQMIGSPQRPISELAMFARAAAVIGFISHTTLFICLGSIIGWPMKGKALTISSSVIVGIASWLGETVFITGVFLAIVQKLPAFVQRRIGTGQCPFTDQVDADEECSICSAKIHYDVAEVEYDQDSDDEEDEKYMPDNRKVSCPYCVLRWKYMFVLPIGFAAIAFGLIHLAIRNLPVVPYITWYIGGLIGIVLVYFMLLHLNQEASVIRMFVNYLWPAKMSREYQLLESLKSPIELLRTGSPIVNSPVVINNAM